MIAIIDYGLGNLGSVKNALDKLGVCSMICTSSSGIQKADGFILPGVGAAGEGIKNLRDRKLDVIIKQEIKKGKPILGICLGMQLLMTTSEEGNVDCLSSIEGQVKLFKSKLKIPQIGWNTVKAVKSSALFKNIPTNSYFYFVHSYFCVPAAELSIATTSYGEEFCSACQNKNIFGVQFHPEKSGTNGLQLLKNFIDISYENNSSD
jgi:glutamine amidotransferase